MRIEKIDITTYESPNMVMYEILTERGFNLSGGISIEQVEGREEEIEW